MSHHLGTTLRSAFCALALLGNTAAFAADFAIDQNNGAVFDAVLDGFPFPPPGVPQNGSPDFGGNALAVALQSGVTELRSIAEFPLASLTGLTSADISSATLTFNIDDVISTFGPGTTFSGAAADRFILFAYSGDGTVDLTDFDNVAGSPLAIVDTTVVGTVTDATLALSGPLTFQVDVKAVLGALLDTSATHLGIVWTTDDDGTATSIDNLGDGGAGPPGVGDSFMPLLSVRTVVLTPPLLTKEARGCQKALGKFAGGYASVIQKNLANCLDQTLAATAKGQDLTKIAAKCQKALVPADPTSKVGKAAGKLSSAIASKCGGVDPVELGSLCDPVATNMGQVAACILDQHRNRTQSMVAAQYGSSCALINAVDLAADYPLLCAVP